MTIMAGTTQFQLAQFNISRLKAPLEAREMKEFVDFLEPVNRFAEECPGFVWRMKGENGEASSLLSPAFDDPMIVTNLTVWENMDALKAFVHFSVHRYFVQNRRSWFERVDGPQVVIWWIEKERIPTLQEAKAKLELLASRGPSPDGFTFAQPFDAPLK
jgi:hypothetical protein